MTAQTLEDMLVTDAEISGYMEKRDNQEHLKIKNPSEYINDVKEYFSEDLTGGLALPFAKTHTDFRIRSGEVTLCTGYSGHGKSAWLNYVMLHLLQQQKTMIASFEMLPKQTLGRLCQQSGEAMPNDDYIQDFINKLERRLYMYDPQGETSAKKVLEVIYYCAEKLGVKLMVIDSLMKCGINEDDLNRQKKFLDDLAVASRDLNIHLFIVAHSRKTQSDYTHATKLDVAGSANITNLVDNVLSVHRNKEREEAEREADTSNPILDSAKCSVHLVKQRHGKGVEAKWKFDFHPDTFSYSEWMR